MSAPSSEEGLNALDNIIAENEKRGDWGALALFGEAFPTSLSTVDDSSVSPMLQQQFASPEEAFAHFGVKGMHWGIRKENQSASPDLQLRSNGVTIRRDGSMDILPGANLQRLSRSSGKSLPMKDITYASLNDYDNSRYIKSIGGKGFLGGGRDQILSIQATKTIKAPSTLEATKMVSDLMIKDSTFRSKNTDILGREISSKDLDSIRKNPTGKTAQEWYFSTNQGLTFDTSFDPNAAHVQSTVQKTMSDKGYTALRDENDIRSKIAKAPIIIFNPKDSLKVVKVTDITDELRKANKQKLKRYKTAGKGWIDKELYND